MIVLWLVLFAVLAAGVDYLSCVWHRARERGARGTGAAVSVALDVLGWLPIWFAIDWQDVRILVASAIGSGIGSVLGFRGQKEDDSQRL